MLGGGSRSPSKSPSKSSSETSGGAASESHTSDTSTGGVPSTTDTDQSDPSSFSDDSSMVEHGGFFANFLTRLKKVCKTIWEMILTTYRMLCLMYTYPNAARHATWITYKAVMLSYRYDLWSLLGVYSLMNKEKPPPPPKPKALVLKPPESVGWLARLSFAPAQKGPLSSTKSASSTSTSSQWSMDGISNYLTFGTEKKPDEVVPDAKKSPNTSARKRAETASKAKLPGEKVAESPAKVQPAAISPSKKAAKPAEKAKSVRSLASATKAVTAKQTGNKIPVPVASKTSLRDDVTQSEGDTTQPASPRPAAASTTSANLAAADGGARRRNVPKK